LGRDRRKIFEIYDRIAIGGIGHPGDIERLRVMATELASTEGFTGSAADVSLSRMANYSFSPASKQAFEQIYGPPLEVRQGDGVAKFLRIGILNHAI
jgi:proteasome alpha subunit